MELLKIFKMFKDVEIPERATIRSSGFDIRAYLYDEVTGEKISKIIIQPFQRVLVTTGLKFEIPKGHEVQLRPRSGLSIKNGITLVNCVGTIDEDYRGEIKVPIINLSAEPFELEDGMRIVQGVLAEVVNYLVVETSILSNTKRESNGFGSSGIK